MATGDAEAVIKLAIAAAEPVEIDPTKKYVVVTPEQGLEIVNPDEDTWDAPRRSKGIVTVSDVESLKVLFDKHAEPRSEVFADDERHTFTVVLNADEGAGLTAGFGDHRLTLTLRQTPSWKAWASIDGKMVTQQAFAEFIEDHLLDIERPSAADMLELAQSFEASISADFKSASMLESGARGIRFEETIQAKAGQTGQLEIPKDIGLAIQPFEGGPAYRIMARLRYRIREGNLSLGIKLERPEDVVREAFAEVVEKVRDATGAPVIKGTAAPARR